ncbi:MAG TPA: OmpH family outer membrane protein [Bryobacteraceae bacterium]|nr:OmpH family outer membrane protein [Bryobacteraceae bacterium]
MSFRMPVGPLLVCSALFVAAQGGFAQTKAAVVNMQAAVYGTAEAKKADADLQARFKPRQDEIQNLNKEIESLSSRLQSGKLSPEDEADVTVLFKRKQTELQRKQDDFTADFQVFRDEVLQKMGAKMQAVVKKLAEEKGYDLVLEATSAIFFKGALDITTDAIAAYDKANPVAPAAK